MAIKAIVPIQSVTATGGLGDVSVAGGLARTVTLIANALNTAGSSPTLALKIQSSPPLAPGQNNTLVGATDNLLKSGSTTNVDLGAKFTTGAAVSIKSASLMLKLIGTITGTSTVTLAVYADSSGPTGSALATVTLTINQLIALGLTSSYSYIPFAFTVPGDLAASTVYWLQLSTNYTASGTNCLSWRTSTSLGATANFGTYNATSWTVSSTDAAEFLTYVYTFTDPASSAGVFTIPSALNAANGSAQMLLPITTQLLQAVVRGYATIGGTSSPAFTVDVTVDEKLAYGI